MNQKEIILKTAENDILDFLTQIKTLDQAYLLETDTSVLESLKSQRKSLLSQVKSTTENALSLLDTIESNRLTIIDGIETLNNSILPNSIFEENEKFVNSVFLSTVARGVLTLDTSQFKLISGIAHQCPLLGGHIVYRARMLYNLNEEKEFDDEIICGEYQERRQSNTHSNKDGILIYPNPSDSELNILLERERHR